MNWISKTVYIDELDDIVSKCKNTYHSTIKIKPVDKSNAHILTSIRRLLKKILKLSLVTMSGYWNIKTFLQNSTSKLLRIRSFCDWKR